MADAVAHAVVDERAANQIFNVGEEEVPTRKKWIETIGKASGWGVEVVVLPKDLLPEHLKSPYGFGHDLVVDTSRIREELGYKEKVPKDEAIQKTIAWERENPPTDIDPQKFDYVAEAAAVEKLSERGN